MSLICFIAALMGISVCSFMRVNTVDHLDKLFTFTSHKHIKAHSRIADTAHLSQHLQLPSSLIAPSGILQEVWQISRTLCSRYKLSVIRTASLTSSPVHSVTSSIHVLSLSMCSINLDTNYMALSEDEPRPCE